MTERDTAANPIVTVFGASKAAPGDGVYEIGVRCGELLALAGFGVATGGYGGLMEAVSRGARSEGGEALGVTAPDIFRNRPGANEFVTEEWRAAHLMERIHELTDVGSASIALPGSLGTLTEVAVAWNLAFITRFSGANAKPVVTIGDNWRRLIDHLAVELETDRSLVECVDTVDEAVDHLVERLQPGGA